MDYLDIHIEGVILEVIEFQSYYYIDSLIVDHKFRNKGLGSKALNYIINLAKTNNKKIALYASDLLGSNINFLNKWYLSLGFKKTKGILNEMYEFNFEYLI